jgi:hypothetical protein
MHNLKELKIWQKAVELATEVYQLTAEFPKEEKYGLTSQIRRSVVSIPSNIAEGAGRNSDREFVQFLSISNVMNFKRNSLFRRTLVLSAQALTSSLIRSIKYRK